jgi:EAL domain-containing protein (putative c-di-GMP-specific phosphodiesterase class I)/GGDEF domain-containing protein
VTGLPNRRHFIGRLGSSLGEPGMPPATLLILRLSHLAGLNQRLGHEATDQLLATVAEVVAAYPRRVAGAFAGRLNGSDFALFLPVSGVAEETAGTLLGALRASLASWTAGIELVVGGIETLQAASATEALAAADEALAQAEAAGPFCIEIRHLGSEGEPARGERAWRERIELALAEGRAGLGEFPVRDAAGGLLHLECPLRVQFEVGGPFQVASRWLAMASRGRLLPLVDLAALDLALAAIANDRRPRCVHVGAASLASAGFVGEVQQRLVGAPEAGALLWIDVAEGASLERSLPRLREASAAWRRHGVHLGLEHAGASMQALPRLGGVGLDHIKIEGRFVRGVDQDAAVRQFAAGLVALAHGMGWKIIAEGIDDARDLGALWALGFDGATGPALS